MKTLDLNPELEATFVKVCDNALRYAGVGIMQEINALWNGVKKKPEPQEVKVVE